MTETRKDLRILVVGCGSIGKRHARILHELGVKELCLCDLLPDRRKAVLNEVEPAAEVDSYDAGLAWKPDAVFLCTPPSLHVPQARQAIHVGCHVFTEKPLSDSLDDVDQLSAEIAASDCKFMVGLCFRYHEGLLKAKAMLDNGRIGRLVSVRALMGEHLPEVRPDYRSLFVIQHGGAFDLMHEIDLAMWFAGQDVDTVQCIHGAYSDLGFEASDVAEILIGFRDRCVASVHLDFFQRPRRRQIELIGTHGTIIVEFARWEQCTVSLYESPAGAWVEETLATDRNDMFRDEDREFLTAVTEGTPIENTLFEGLKSLKVVLAAQVVAIR